MTPRELFLSNMAGGGGGGGGGGGWKYLVATAGLEAFRKSGIMNNIV